MQFDSFEGIVSFTSVHVNVSNLQSFDTFLKIKYGLSFSVTLVIVHAQQFEQLIVLPGPKNELKYLYESSK